MKFCENTDHTGTDKDVRTIQLTDEFDGDKCDWCENCRARDGSMIDFVCAICPLCDEVLEHRNMNGTHGYFCPACAFVGFEANTNADDIEIARYFNNKER
jgi:hypothetical protein